MSHELRTPLNAMLEYSEMIAEDAQDAGNAALAADVGRIHAAATQLLGLINDVLDISRIKAGKVDSAAQSALAAALPMATAPGAAGRDRVRSASAA